MYLLDAWRVDHLQRLVDFQKRTETCRYAKKWKRSAIKRGQRVQIKTLLYFFFYIGLLTKLWTLSVYRITALQAISVSACKTDLPQPGSLAEREWGSGEGTEGCYSFWWYLTVNHQSSRCTWTREVRKWFDDSSITICDIWVRKLDIYDTWVLSDLFWEGCREEETLSSQNFLMASVVRAWSAL